MRRFAVVVLSGFMLSLSLTVPAQAAGVTASLVHVIDASAWSPPSPDTSGLVYRASTGTLVVVDGEVEEFSAPMYQGVNIWDITTQGAVQRTATTAANPRAPIVSPPTPPYFSNEPTDVAINPANGHFFISDDDADRIFEVDPGADGWIGGGDDAMISRVRTNTTNFLCKTDPSITDCDSEGVAYALGSLWVASGVETEIYRIAPGPNGHFDNGVSGPPPTNGDDVITHFDSNALGMHNPEGVTYDPVSGNLYIVSEADKFIAETTTTGELVALIDITGSGIRKPSGIALAPASNNPAQTNVYVSDRAVDNNTNPGENDGKIYEFHLTAVAGNRPPVVSPLPKQFNVDGDVVNVQAAAVDPNGDPITYSATNLPPGVTIDANTGMMSGTIATGAYLNGPYNVEVTAFDGTDSASTTFAWAVSRIYADLTQTIETSGWSPPSPDPGGLAYRSDTGQMLMADGEVEEVAIYAGVNVWQFTSDGTVTGTGSTANNPPTDPTTPPAFSNEPTDVAWSSDNGHLFFSDDSLRRIFEVDLGPDGDLGTNDDVVTNFRTLPFGSDDPEGVTYALGDLWIADGLSSSVFRVDPGVDGIFNGIAPGGDDTVTSVDTGVLGINDTEGVEYDEATDTLWIVSATERIAVEMTPAGTKIDQLDLSQSLLKKPGGVTIAPSSADPFATSLWIADRAIDNNTDPTENDGLILEFSLPGHPVGNHPPVVTNPGDQTSAKGASVNLQIVASDLDGDTLTYGATGLPAGLSIGTATGLITGTVDPAAAAGSPYNVLVSATDGNAGDSESFTWTITNAAPVVTNPGDQTSAKGASVNLQIVASDPDGDTLTYGATGLPAGLSIGTATGLITGTVDPAAAAGSPYNVLVSATDGNAGDSESFTWTITNAAPVVTNPGDQTNNQGDVVSLQVVATDGDNDPLTYSATSLPTGLSIDPTTGLISGTVGSTAAAGSPYASKVTASDGAVADSKAFTWTVIDPPPAAPTGLVLTPQSGGIALDWANNTESDLGGYNVYRSVGGGPFTKLNGALIAASAYFDGAAPAGQTSTYRVTAVDATAHESAPVEGSAARGKIVLKSASTGSSSKSTSVSISKPSGVASGNVLVATITGAGVTGGPNITAPSGSGWTLIQTRAIGSMRQSMFVKVAGGSEPTSYSFSTSAKVTISGAILAYSGVDTLTPVDVSGGQTNASSTAITAPSLNGSLGGEVLVGAFGTLVSASISPAALMDERAEKVAGGSPKVTLEMADDFLMDAGSTSARIATASSAGQNIGLVLILKPAP